MRELGFAYGTGDGLTILQDDAASQDEGNSIFITDSFNTKQLIKNIEKVLPEITTQLNMSLFGSALKNNSVSLGCWIWNGDHLISCITDELVNLLPEDILLKDDDLITALFYSAKDGTVIYDGPSDYEASSWFSVIYF